MNDLEDLVRKLLKVSIPHSVQPEPHVERLEVTTCADGDNRRYLPGKSSVTVIVEMEVPDTPQARRVLPETFDRLDRMKKQKGSPTSDR